jgi:23S rRNA (cytosine1962-C5)-methyltransferase
MSRTALPLVRLATDELPRGPWIFGRQVEPAPGVEDGALVEVGDASGRFIGHALYNGASDIRLRLLSRGRRNALEKPREFLLARLREADKLRRRTLRIADTSDVYRVVHAEGDDLPGLVVDRLNGVLVCEHHALGFWRLREEISRALAELYPGLCVLHKVPSSVRKAESFPEELGPEEAPPEVEIHEHGLAFPVRAGAEHKTGWFCDQRENRMLLARLCAGRGVLDLCCNAGGFALQAKKHGAREVRGVDLDEKALSRAQEAARRNGLEAEFVHADAFDFLRAELGRTSGPRPDVVILDPHKLIRGKVGVEVGKKKYADFNTLALSAVRPGGLLATFSCSGALDLPSFLGIVFGAARRAEREIKLLSLLEAGPDHPQRPDFPRSRYLKGALLAVDE